MLIAFKQRDLSYQIGLVFYLISKATSDDFFQNENKRKKTCFIQRCCDIAASARPLPVASFVDNQTRPSFWPWPPPIPAGQTSPWPASLPPPRPVRTHLQNQNTFLRYLKNLQRIYIYSRFLNHSLFLQAILPPILFLLKQGAHDMEQTCVLPMIPCRKWK